VCVHAHMLVCACVRERKLDLWNQMYVVLKHMKPEMFKNALTYTPDKLSVS